MCFFVLAYVKRVIAHPSFHNIDYKMCERMMVNMDQGDVIFRPSSKVMQLLVMPSQQTRDIEPMLGQCWADVLDVGPTLIQLCFNVSCLLGNNDCLLYLPLS